MRVRRGEGGDRQCVVLKEVHALLLCSSPPLSPPPLSLFPSQKIGEEQELRQDLQVKLLQSEQQLLQLKQMIGQPPNGPAPEFPDGSEFSPSKKVAMVVPWWCSGIAAC